MRELDKVLDDNEKVFWEGKPNFWPFFFGRSIFAFILGIILLFFMLPFIIILIFIAVMGILSNSMAGTLVAFASILPILIPISLLMGGVMLYNYLAYKYVYYAITNKRVVIQTGLIGRDFRTVDFDQITNAAVDVGLFDKLFSKSSGSIIISGGLGHSVLSNIPDPYNVFKFFKKVSFDVKTDIEYPNKLRPKTNPGYGTGYSAPKTPSKRKQSHK
jgi:membrane protein YdbS with pleckstrin-like domain